MDPSTAMMIASIAGPTVAGMFGTDGQELNSFEGNGAISPVAMLSQSNAMMNALGKALTGRAMSPIDLSASVVQQPGAYTGGSLPFPIGMVASDPALGDASMLSDPGMREFGDLNAMFDGALRGQYAFPSMTPGPGASTPPGAGMTGPDTMIPGSGIDPDGPLGWDAPLGDAFDDFFMPGFDQRTPQNPNGTTDGAEPTPRNAAESRTGDGMGPRRKGFGLRASDILHDGASGVGTKTVVNGGDDLEQGHGAAQLLMDALGSGDDAVLEALVNGGTLPPSMFGKSPSFAQLV